ncbi:MAG: glycoside hydrolase family 36 protein [Halanaerobiales bacterium]
MNIDKSLGKNRVNAGDFNFELEYPLPLIKNSKEEIKRLGTKKLWQWIKRDKNILKMGSAGRGTQLVDYYHYGNLKLKRFIWKRTGKNIIAVKWELQNTGKNMIKVDSFQPLRIKNIIPEIGEKQVRIFRQGRLKNDRPQVIKGTLSSLTKNNEEFKNIISDPFLQITPGDKDIKSQLFMGFLTFKSCLKGCQIKWDKKNRKIANSFNTICELDGLELSPGKITESEWLWINWEHQLPERVLKEYTRTAAVVNDINPPDNPPSVYLSWYYLREKFTEKDLEENLQWLEDNPLPLDVIQIDSCWEQNYGDWQANEEWPSGMKKAASAIKKQGYTAGLWTCPYLAKTDSALYREHPEWILKDDNNNKITFTVNDKTSYVLDPTHPEVLTWLEKIYNKFTREWGFTYHKLDFMRAAILEEAVQYYDSECTRAEAYRRGLKAIRKGTGDSAYILVCGGLYGPSAGIADGQRTGSDVHGKWDDKTRKTLTQSLFRTWMSDFWNTDPDALMIRRRKKPFKGEELSLGLFSDSEVRVLALNQYLGGGIVSVSERLLDFDQDRLKLWRHIIPAAGYPSVPIDLFEAEDFPSIYYTRISSEAGELDDWQTVTLLNTSDKVREFELRLDERLIGEVDRDNSVNIFLAWDFFKEEFIGSFSFGQKLPLIKVPPHDGRIFRLVSWKGEAPVLLGTNLHFSGGGVEIDSWQVKEKQVEFIFKTEWKGKASVWVAFPDRKNDKRNPEIVKTEIKCPADNRKIILGNE